MCVIEFDQSDFYCLVSVETSALTSLQEFEISMIEAVSFKCAAGFEPQQ